jgi:hypothetical protein
MIRNKDLLMMYPGVPAYLLTNSSLKMLIKSLLKNSKKLRVIIRIPLKVKSRKHLNLTEGATLTWLLSHRFRKIYSLEAFTIQKKLSNKKVKIQKHTEALKERQKTALTFLFSWTF